MSLISQTDRELTVEALNFYLLSKNNELTEEKKSQLNALLNWIKLEHYKNA